VRHAWRAGSACPPAFPTASALLAGLLVVVALAAPAVARADPAAAERGFFRCEKPIAPPGEKLRSKATIDVYHGVTWLVGAGGFNFLGRTKRHWTRENDLDSTIRDGFRIDSNQARRDADSVSDFTVALSAALLPAAAIGGAYLRDHDCAESWALFGRTVEAVGLALFVSEAFKQVAGRERPFGDRCADDPPSDVNCKDDDRNKSFMSGHATLAAAGAGLTCRFALDRNAFGKSPIARMAPCVVGIAGAFVTGALRVASDRHWGTDVLVGFGAGALIGTFDTWGPLEWLRFEQHDAAGEVEAVGFVLPYANDGRFGAQLSVVY